MTPFKTQKQELQDAKAVLLAREQAELELLRAKQELEASHRRISSILDSITDAFVALDQQWHFTFVNSRAEEILRPLKKDRQELLGRKLWDAFPDLEGTPFAEHYRRALRDQVTVHFEAYYPPLQAWFEVRTYPASGGLSIYFQDITERRAAQEALRTNEQLLRATFHQAAVGMAIADLTGHFQRVNRKFTEILGYSPEELNHLTFRDITHPDDLPLTTERVNQLLSGELQEIAYEKRYVRKDGSSFWSLSTVTLLKDPSGQPVRYIGVIEDITRRKEVEQALRESEARFRTAFASAAIGVAITTVDGVLLETNPAFHQITGYSPEDLRNTPFPEIIYPEDREENLRWIQRLLQGAIPGFVLRNRYLRKEGKPVWVRKSVSVVRDDRGKPLRLLALIEDITERKRAEEALSQRIRLTSLRAEIGETIASNHRVQELLQRCTELLVNYLDAAFARIWLTAPSGDLLELQASAGLYTHLDGPHSRVRFGELKIGRIAQTREPHLTTDVQNDPNISDPDWAKQERMVAFAGYPMVIEDKVLGVIALFSRHPIAAEVLNELALIADSLAQWLQRTRAEHALRESERKLAQANAELDRNVQERTASLQKAIAQLEEFSYSVSHDLRSPLRAIEGYTSFIREDFGPDLPPQALEYLEKISANTVRMNRLINDVLTLSRVTRTELRPQKIFVPALLAEVIEQNPEVQPPHADLQIAADVWVLGDEVSLSQAFSNLLNNAIKFVAPGVKPCVRIRSETRDDYVRLWIEDNGIGIKPEYQGKLFNLFERLHANPEYQGTGVGLAIVKKAVERMNGRVGVVSDGCTGSRFWLELPPARTPCTPDLPPENSRNP